MAKEPAFDARAYSRRNMLARHGMTEADLGSKEAKAEREAAELAALPKTLAEAKGDSRALMKADMQRRVAAEEGKGPASASRASMESLLRAQGIEPVKR